LLVRRASIGGPEKHQRLQVSGQAFGRHDRATHHGNISLLVANEVEAFSGERGGSLAVSKKSSLWRSQDKLSVEMIEDRVNA